ncbi:carboxymuconolactone decarboxylase family protein [Maribellus maritimus]|uniref:carboxymuconolactone decarboxylase family protein n=1 Tax=Maribellus maritimus TaxID=2870838 RepID=UPI001EECBEFE|nr:carboxymuconolactone decarboxylase family protein [Maribellus maritimus]MCG6190270.1 carboxymuconolactone decarboxylase family protein [Maribellus maritimus]
METHYYDIYKKVYSGMGELAKENPELMKGFGMLHKTNSSDGALTKKEKELLAVAIAIVVHCEGCIACHVKDALQSGATHNQIVEAIGVAILMGGGPALVYGTMALDALKEFEGMENN